jgi:hypothetical protein
VPTDVLLDPRAQRSGLHEGIVGPETGHYSASRVTGGDGDTFLIETSAGQLTVQYGWNRWVSVQARGAVMRRAVVGNRRGLARLLADAGVPDAEAHTVASRLWKDRPRGSARGTEADAWRGPWKQHPNGTLIVFLIGLVAAVLVVVVLKLDWVGV